MCSHNVIWGHKSGQGLGIHGALCSRRIANPHTHTTSPLSLKACHYRHTQASFPPDMGTGKQGNQKWRGKKEIVFERKWGWVSQSWGFGTATDDISTFVSTLSPRSSSVSDPLQKKTAAPLYDPEFTSSSLWQLSRCDKRGPKARQLLVGILVIWRVP